MSAELSEAKQQRLADKQSQAPDLVVVSALKDWTCTNCSNGGDLLIMEGPGPLCLSCADLDHLVFLPAGDTALTRRAKKASGLSAVVVRFSRSRGHYERQGLLVEEDALVRRAQMPWPTKWPGGADASVRNPGETRKTSRFTRHSPCDHPAFPGCPSERADTIARHASQKSSGRVDRTAAGRALDQEAVTWPWSRRCATSTPPTTSS